MSQAAQERPAVAFPFNNTYARLPERLHRRTMPVPVATPRLIQLNRALAEDLGLDADYLASPEGVQILAGNALAPGSEPLAQAYAGHQFGHFVPQLGDGRAILLGELTARQGQLYDVQLKGAGRTPFSRGGDGRAALGPVLREYLLSEAMTALGVPSTRALAAVTTGETVWRETPLPGAVLTRVAASHLRVGTFQYFAARQDTEALQHLVRFALARHYPSLDPESRPAGALLRGVIERQARLVAQWVSLGFIHGVMNTDNMSISGETIDYGPCAFMEAYHPETVFSSIDRNGRYSYRNQPAAALWNLMRLAEALLPVILVEEGAEESALAVANNALATFEPLFEDARLAHFRRKLGLFNQEADDPALVEDLLTRMAAGQADFTLFFRRLSHAAAASNGEEELAGLTELFTNPGSFAEWAARWRDRLARDPRPETERAEAMLGINPAHIPRNHQVEAAIQGAVQREDFGPFYRLLQVVTDPFVEKAGQEDLLSPARPDQQVLQTFCGT